MIRSLVAFYLCLAVGNICQADVTTVFDSSFTNPDFVDGSIGFGGANPDSIIGQGGFTISDSAGVGILNGATSFQRALFGWNPSDSFDQALVNSLAAGDTIEISATNLVFNPTGTNVGVFGLSNYDDGNILGGSLIAAGVQFVWSGTSLFLDRNTNFTGNQDVDTGLGSGESFDYLQRYISNGDGSYEIEHYINGGLLTTSTGITPTFTFATTTFETTGFIQDQGGAGAWSVDSLSLSFQVTTIPEPSAALLIGLATAGIGFIRRK